MAKKKINQITATTTIADTDLGLSGNPTTGESKKITWLNIFNYIASKLSISSVPGLQSALENGVGLQLYNKEVIFFGDSYTEGSGATSTAKRWTSLFSKSTGAIEINNGIAGTTLEDRVPVDYMAGPNMVDRIGSIPTKDTGNALLVFAYGLNDMGYNGGNYTTANYKTDYQTVLNAAFAQGWSPKNILIIPAYYIGAAGYAEYAITTGRPAPDQAWHLSFVQAAKEVAQTNNTLYFDIFNAQLRNDTTLIDPDHIHPTDAGHEFIADAILRYVAGKSYATGNSAIVEGAALTLQGDSATKAVNLLNVTDASNFPAAGLYPNTSGANAGTALSLIPKGTGLDSTTKTQFGLFNTDYIADRTNYEVLLVKSSGADYQIDSTEGGTGTVRPIKVKMGGTDATTFKTDLSLEQAGNVKSLANVLGVQGQFNDGTQGLIIRAYTGASGFGAIYVHGITPDNNNFCFASDGTVTFLAGAKLSVNITTGEVKFGTVPPDYADNAAALAGGKTAGSIYRTGDLLKIVH